MRALLGGIAAGVVLALAGPTLAQPKDVLAHGHDVFQYWCATCHGAGPGHPGTDALQAKYHGEKPALLEDRRDLTPDQTRFFVRHGVTIMPFFRKTEISDADLDAIGAYLARKR
jgi:mono/diheme cytochrome c family protein